MKEKIKKVPAARRRQRTTPVQLIKDNKALEDATIYYRNGKNSPVLATGKLTLAGVLCCCCQNLFTLTKFEVHAGSTNHRPAANIFLENGVSLQDCQDQLKTERNGFTQTVKSSEEHCTDKKRKRNDFTKIVKERRGTDKKLSETAWVTPKIGKSAKISNVPGTKHEELSDMCDSDNDNALQIFKNDQESLECCKLNDNICSICCKNGDLVLCDQCPASFHVSCLGLTMVPPCRLWYCPYCCCKICGQICKVIKGKSAELCTDDYERVVRCEQCMKPFHKLCVQEDGYIDGNWFCTTGCENLFYGLRRLLGKEITVEGHDDLKWSVLQNFDGIDPRSLEKLKSALAVIDECFDPSEEYRTRMDIHEILVLNKGAEYNLDYLRGFYIVILEKGGVVSTVATIRVHGVKVAEIPLVGTCLKNRGQGQCRLFIDLLEKVLFEFGVARLVLPALNKKDVKEMWQDHFGFHPMTEFEQLNLIGYNMLNFDGTILYQKNLKRIVGSYAF